jgi:hypothetical protein
VTLETAATYNCTTTDGRFFAIGSRFSYYTNEYLFDLVTINPEEVMQTGGASGVSTDFPGTVYDDLLALGMPYGIYVNPYSGYIYATDAGSFAAAGALYQWTPDGQFVNSYKVYINPAHFLALPPYDQSGITETASTEANDGGTIYNLQGMEVTHPVTGRVYIKNGTKFLAK